MDISNKEIQMPKSNRTFKEKDYSASKVFDQF